MLSELATNGLRHGQGEVMIRATIRRDGTILIAVNDGGDRTTSAEPQVQHVDMNRLGGMGLRIVGTLSTDWGVVRYPGGTTVWVELAGGNAA